MPLTTRDTKLLRGLLQEGDQVVAVFLLLETCKGHFGAFNKFPWLHKVLRHRLCVPNKTSLPRLFHGFGKPVLWGGARLAAEDAGETRANSVLAGYERMACFAFIKDFFSLGHICGVHVRCQRQGQKGYHRDERYSCHELDPV